jgi:squalene-hopene/tetraprenyl-beta-curcumene cyclase
MIALVLATLPLLLQEPSGVVPAFDPKQDIDAEVVSDEIDLSLHWLHTRFDQAKGTYGSLEADAWAVLAFAEAPRKYRPADGPFLAKPLQNLLAAQRPDGSFAPEVPPGVAVYALESVQEDGPRAAAAKLRAKLGQVATRPEPASADGARARARELLVARKLDGSWGDVVTSARTIDELGRLQAYIETAEGTHPPRKVQPLPRIEAPQKAQLDKAVARGAQFLLTQVIDGGWGFSGHRDAGITAMVLGGLLAVPEPRPPEVQKAAQTALDWLLSLQHEDGSIHEGQLANYVTSACVQALAKSGRPKDLAAIAKARDFLKALQADEADGYSPGDRFYGGVGYGDDEKPDLSNMQHALEALRTAGVPTSDPVFQRAIVFLQRCQNRSESNDLVLVRDGKTFTSGNDGGAIYAPADSKAGFVELPDGKRVPRSYGSMSYALLKCYLFAGLSKDDPRVQAVWKWVRENYTLDVNPGFQASDDPAASYQGLFYYFNTMAKALDLFGEERITDAAGQTHEWRGELCGRLLAMQRQDGSWINANAARWFEGNPALATAYARCSRSARRGASPRNPSAGNARLQPGCARTRPLSSLGRPRSRAGARRLLRQAPVVDLLHPARVFPFWKKLHCDENASGPSSSIRASSMWRWSRVARLVASRGEAQPLGRDLGGDGVGWLPATQ